MKSFIFDFLRRGSMSFGIGPLVLALIYAVLHKSGAIDTLTLREVCVGIASVSALAFVAGGMNALYRIDKLPLMAAVLIHGSVLYFGYLIAYLLNDWLERSAVAFLVFTAVFVVGYFVIWGVIYLIISHNTKKVNAVLEKCRREN